MIWSRWLACRFRLQRRRPHQVLEARALIVLVLVVVLDSCVVSHGALYPLIAPYGKLASRPLHASKFEDEDDDEYEDDQRLARLARWIFLLPERMNQERNSN